MLETRPFHLKPPRSKRHALQWLGGLLVICLATVFAPDSAWGDDEVLATDLSLESISIVSRSEKSVSYRYTIRNNSEHALDWRQVSVQAYLADSETLSTSAGREHNKPAGGASLRGCRTLAPGESCTGKYRASRGEKQFPWLHIRIRARQGANDSKTDNNSLALEVPKLEADLPATVTASWAIVEDQQDPVGRKAPVEPSEPSTSEQSSDSEQSKSPPKGTPPKESPPQETSRPRENAARDNRRNLQITPLKNLSVESLSIVSREHGKLGFRCMIRNHGTQEITPSRIRVNATLANAEVLSDSRKPGESQSVGGWAMSGCSKVYPSKSCTGFFRASLPEDDYDYLHVRLTMAGKTGGEKTTLAIAIPPEGASLPVTLKAPWAAPSASGPSTMFYLVLAVMLLPFFVPVVLVVWYVARSRKAKQQQSDSSGNPKFPSRGIPSYARQFDFNPEESEARSFGSRLGFHPVESAAPRIKAAIESLFGAGDVLRMQQRKVKGGLLTLCDIRTERTVHRNDDPSYTVITYRTVLLCEGHENVDFPPFNVVPKAGIVGIGLFNPLIRMLGGGSIDAHQFAKDPEFNQRLMVGTTVPNQTRALFTSEVREVLKQHSEFIVNAHDDCIAVSLPTVSQPKPRSLFSNSADDRVESGVISGEDWHQFVSRGAKVIQALRGQEYATRDSQSGSDSELNDFLKEAPPRLVPRRFAGRGMSSEPFLRIWSLIMCVMAIVVGTLFALAPGGLWIGLIILVVGGSMGGAWPLYNWQKSHRKLKLLRRGQVVQAKVVDVSRSSMVFTSGSSQSRRYKATFQFELNGTQRQATQAVWGGHGYGLIKLKDQATPTDLLVDPSQPERVLWVESAASG